MTPALRLAAPRGVFGWKGWRLADAYDLPELNAIREAVEKEPGARRPEAERSLYIFTAPTMKRLDALSWAVTYRLRKDRP